MILLKCLFKKKEEKTIKEKINNVDAKKKIFSVAKFFYYLIFLSGLRIGASHFVRVSQPSRHSVTALARCAGCSQLA